MKTLLLVLLPLLAYPQFAEHFEHFKHWTGDTSYFEINSSNQLNLNAETSTGQAMIWRNSSAIFDAQWRIKFTLDLILPLVITQKFIW